MRRHHLEKYARILLALDKIWLPVSHLSSLLAKNKKAQSNILVLKLYEKGAVALVSPLITELSEHGEEVYFATLDLNEDTLMFLPNQKKENVFLFNTTSLYNFILSLFRYISWSRKLGFKSVFNLDIFSNISNVIMNFSLARTQYQISDTESKTRVSYNSNLHIYDHYRALFDKSVAMSKEAPVYPNLFTNTKNKTISFYINTNDPLKQRSWSYENWKSLIEKCKTEYGSEYNIKVFAPFVEHCKEFDELFSHYYYPTKSLQDLMNEISESMVFITTDCGPSHFSAFCDTQTITLFGPESPRFFGSLSPRNRKIFSAAICSPCFNQYNKCLSNCDDNICMKSISVDSVMEHINLSLGAYDVSA